MLTPIRSRTNRALVGLACLLTLGLIPAPEATADPPVTCTKTTWSTSECSVEVGNGSYPGSDPGSSSSTGTVTCWSRTAGEVPCQTGTGLWDGSRDCYVKADLDLTQMKDPDQLDALRRAIYDRHGPVGWIMNCTIPLRDGNTAALSTPFWAADRSAAPDPRVLAERAVATMALEAPQMGVWPGGWHDQNPRAWGAVGIPVWFWAQNPKPGVAGTATASATADGRTVIAQAKLTSITWTDDAGHHATCGTGSKPAAFDETAWESPSGCGWTYDKEGDYTITAVTRIKVEWSGLGHNGVIDLTLTTPTHTLRIGEIQIVTRTGPN
jgi:hypothetical protein